MDLSQLVDLPNTIVNDAVKNKQGDIFITVETTESSVTCRICKKKITCRHGYDKERKLRHLPVFGRPTFIIYKPHRYICEECDDQPTTTATPAWHKPNSTYTIDYETHILMELVNVSPFGSSGAPRAALQTHATERNIPQRTETDVARSTRDTIFPFRRQPDS